MYSLILKARLRLTCFRVRVSLGSKPWVGALARGARSCVFVDSSRVSADITKENISAAGFKDSSSVVTADSIGYLRMCRNTFDLAFLDPPYGKGLIEQALPLLCGHMSERGIIVCEHEKGLECRESDKEPYL